MHKLLVVFFCQRPSCPEFSRPTHLHRWSIVWRQPVFEPSLAWFRSTTDTWKPYNKNLTQIYPNAQGFLMLLKIVQCFFRFPIRKPGEDGQTQEGCGPCGCLWCRGTCGATSGQGIGTLAQNEGIFQTLDRWSQENYVFFRFWGIIPTLWFYWCLFLGIGLNYSHLPIDFNQCLTPFWGLCSFSTRLLSTESERLP